MKFTVLNIFKSKDVDTLSEKKVNSYIEQLKDLLNIVNACKGTHSAIMRMGHGSGWRFMTGAWLERLSDDDFDKVVNEARLNNIEKYSEYDFPKSRRLEEKLCEPLGFVKLTLCD